MIEHYGQDKPHSLVTCQKKRSCTAQVEILLYRIVLCAFTNLTSRRLLICATVLVSSGKNAVHTGKNRLPYTTTTFYSY